MGLDLACYCLSYLEPQCIVVAAMLRRCYGLGFLVVHTCVSSILCYKGKVQCSGVVMDTGCDESLFFLFFLYFWDTFLIPLPLLGGKLPTKRHYKQHSWAFWPSWPFPVTTAFLANLALPRL